VTLADTIMTAGLLLFGMFMLKVFLETRAFLKHLQERHPEEFAKLGAPHWRLQWSDAALRTAMKYIRERQFEPLHDNVLQTSYRAIIVYERFAWGSGAIAVIATLAGPFFK
jgi:hypothetical protein